MKLHRLTVTSTVATAALVLSVIATTPALADTGGKGALPKTQAVALAAADAVLQKTGASSMTLAIVDGTRTVWASTLGAVDAAGTKPSTSTLFGIGSVSKMLATTAVMQLVDAGKVSLDAPVTDYITDFRMASPEYRQITVRMLLDHSAGLPGSDYENAFTSTPFSGYEQQVLDTLATSRLKTTPGSMSVYCNDCFTLAGILVERVSGQPYADYVTGRILRPLGMNLSRYATTPLAAGTFAPVLTDSGTLPVEVTNVLASGGLLSTPQEMGRLASMYMNGGTLDGVRILSAAAVKEMGRSQLPTTLVTAGPAQFVYGLGWDSVAEAGLAAVGVDGWVKGGDTGQYHAAFTVVPEADIAVVIQAAGMTVDSGTLETLAQRIALSALAEKGVIAEVPEPLPLTAPRAVPATEAQTDAITGTYLGQGIAFQVTPSPDGGVLFSLYRGGEWLTHPDPFTMRSDGKYWSTAGTGMALTVSRGWGRTYLVLNAPAGAGHYRDNTVLGQKVTSVDPLSPAWQQRLSGTWLDVTERPESALWEALPTLTLAELPGLNGYLWVADALAPAPVDPHTSDSVATMFLSIPIALGRDLSDLEVVPCAGAECMRFAGATYRPLSSVPAVSTSDVTIGSDGFAEWRTVPSAATVTITGPGSWKAYAPDKSPAGSGAADGASVSLPAGGLLALFGSPGAVLKVRVAS